MIEDELAFAKLSDTADIEQLERDDYVPRLNKVTKLMDVFFECPDHKHKCVSSQGWSRGTASGGGCGGRANMLARFCLLRQVLALCASRQGRQGRELVREDPAGHHASGRQPGQSA